MNTQSIKAIRDAIKAVATDLHLSNYRRLQIQRAEINDPAGWGSYPDCDNSEDACIQRYYHAVDAVYSGRISASVYTNIYMNFKERLARRYGILA